MDKFFTQEFCDRCGKSLEDGRIMSMFNTDCICMDCKDKERKHTDYRRALDTDRKEIKNGNFNYKGIWNK